MKIFLKNLIMFLLMIAIGVAGMMFLKDKKKDIEHDDTQMSAKPVNIMTITKTPFSAKVIAHGNVEPTVVFQGKAEVSGRVAYVHPDLREGGSIPKGTVVVRIDPVDFEISLSQTKSDLASSQSQLDQLKQEQATSRSSLKLAKANLNLGQKEFKRIQSLWKKRLISQSQVDSEEQKVIQLRQSVADTKGRLNTYSSRIKSAEAGISRSKQQVKGGKTTLGRTAITLPFDARISSATLDKNEFVSVGGALFEAINTDAVEIKAELPIKNMQILLSAMRGNTPDLTVSNTQKALQELQLKARVKLIGVSDKAVWNAHVSRISESVDPVRRTIAITVTVDNPYENVIVGERPPLLKGMYVSVELFSLAQDAIVIPRKAIHSGRVYIVDKDQKLEIRPLEILFKQGDIAVIQNGLKEGDQMIVNDLIPVIEGMPLKPLQAKSSKERK